jgi:hypothetical protein
MVRRYYHSQIANPVLSHQYARFVSEGTGAAACGMLREARGQPQGMSLRSAIVQTLMACERLPSRLWFCITPVFGRCGPATSAKNRGSTFPALPPHSGGLRCVKAILGRGQPTLGGSQHP